MAEVQVGVRQFRENIGSYLARARGGESIVIVSRGTPMAQLIPLAKTQRPPPTFGAMKGEIWMADNWDQWDAEELASFEGDPCDI